MSLATPTGPFLATRLGKLTLASRWATAGLDVADPCASLRQLDDHRFLRTVAQMLTTGDTPSLLGMMLRETSRR